MTELTDEEREITLVAVRKLASRYKELLDKVETEPFQENIRDYLAATRTAIQKLDDSESVDVGSGNDSENRNSDCLFVYVPTSIYDGELEKEFRKRIPKHSEHPDRKNVFWSKKYNNFVIRGHEDEAEKAVNVRYGEKATIDKDPKFATKPNTWQDRDGFPRNPQWKQLISRKDPKNSLWAWCTHLSSHHAPLLRELLDVSDPYS